MSRNILMLGTLSLLAPLAVEPPAPDSGTTPGGETRVQMGGGFSSYAFVARGCEGEELDHVPAHGQDLAIAIDHRFARTPFRVGVRGGWLRDEIGNHGDESIDRFPEVPQGQTLFNRYVNPHVELDRDEGAVGLGWVAHEREFVTSGEGARTQIDHPLNDVSGHLRIGRLDDKYFLVSWMEGVPVATGGGYLAMGFGGQLPARRLQGFAGLGAGGPIEGAGPMVHASFATTPNVTVVLKLRAGVSGSVATASGAVGIQYRHASP